MIEWWWLLVIVPVAVGVGGVVVAALFLDLCNPATAIADDELSDLEAHATLRALDEREHVKTLRDQAWQAYRQGVLDSKPNGSSQHRDRA